MRKFILKFLISILSIAAIVSQSDAVAPFARLKVWTQGAVLTSSDLNAEFNTIINQLNTKVLNGGSTFTISAGDSLLVRGRIHADTTWTGITYLNGKVVVVGNGLHNIGAGNSRIDSLFVQDLIAFKSQADTLTSSVDSILVMDQISARFQVKMDTLGSVRDSILVLKKLSVQDSLKAASMRVWGGAKVDGAFTVGGTITVTSGTISGTTQTGNTYGGTNTYTGDITLTQSGGTVTVNIDSTRMSYPDTTFNRASYRLEWYDLSDGRWLEIDGQTGIGAYWSAMAKARNTSWYKELGPMPMVGYVKIHTGQDSVSIVDGRTLKTWMVFVAGSNCFLASGSNVTDVAFKDLRFFVSQANNSGLRSADFLEDRFWVDYGGGRLRSANPTISNRNTSQTFYVSEASVVIVNSTVNAVSVIRDPEGATDSFGRRLPIASVTTAGGLSVSNAGITAFYDLTGAFVTRSESMLPTGDLFAALETGSDDILDWRYSVNTIGADNWTFTTFWRNAASKSEDLPWTSAATISSVDAIPSSSVADGISPIVAFGSDEGFTIAHAKRNDNTNGITIDIDTDNNIARSDTLAWDLGSVSGVFNNPLAVGAAGVTFGDGKIGLAGTSNGTGYLTRYADTALQGVKSISVWAKSTSATNPASAEVFLKLQKFVGAADQNQIFLYFTTDGLINLSTIESATIESATTADVYDANWHHIVATLDGANQRLYVDGVLVDTDALTATLTPDSMSVFAGFGTQVFNGSLDQLTPFTKTLSQNEISALYAQGINSWGNRKDYLASAAVVDVHADESGGTFAVSTADTTYVMNKLGNILSRIGTAGGTIRQAQVYASGDSTKILQATTTKEKVFQPNLRMDEIANDNGPDFARPRARIEHFFGPSNLHHYDAVVDSAGFGNYTQVDQAIDAGAKSIFIKNGTYSPFDADVAGLYIVGESWDVIINGGITDDAIDATAADVYISNLSVKTTGGGGNVYNGITVTAARWHVSRVKFIDSDNAGLATDNVAAADGVIEDSYFVSADAMAIYFAATRNRAINNLIEAVTGDGIYIDSAGSNFSVTSNHIKDTVVIIAGANNGLCVANITDEAVTDNGTGNTVASNEQY